MNFIKTYWLNFAVFLILFLCIGMVWIGNKRCEETELKITNVETVGDKIKVSGTALPNTKLKVILKYE